MEGAGRYGGGGECSAEEDAMRRKMEGWPMEARGRNEEEVRNNGGTWWMREVKGGVIWRGGRP